MKHEFLASGLAVAGLLIALGGCSRSAPDETGWARDALQRNANLEVVSSDPASGAITVRIRSSGEVRVVNAAELIGALPTLAAAAAPSPAPAPAAPALPEPATPAAPAATAAAPAPAPAPEPAAPATASTEAAPAPAATPAAAPGARVLKSGPGYSISAPTVAAAAASGDGSGAARATTLERRHDPIVCQGERLYRIDNQNLAFEGDAVNAEDGCELYISNSHIDAAGAGVVARSANVHIRNSTITGGTSAVDASGGAQVYAQASTFKGMIRRADTATFHDLGGNVGD